MKLSLFYNQQMYLLEDGVGEESNKLTLITDENISLVKNTICLFQNDIQNLSVYFENEAGIEATKALVNAKYGVKDNIIFYNSLENSTSTFIVQRNFLIGFFNKYMISAIVPLQHVLKSLVKDKGGLAGIISEPFSIYREYRPDVYINTDKRNNLGFSSVTNEKENIFLNNDKERMENTLNISVGDLNLENIVIWSTFNGLNIGKNINFIEIAKLYEIINNTPLLIRDIYSDVYRNKKKNKLMLIASSLFSIIAICLGIISLRENIKYNFYQGEIEKVRQNNDALLAEIEQNKKETPNLPLKLFNIDGAYTILQKYSQFSISDMSYTFPNSDSIRITFKVPSALYAEKLVRFLQVNKIKFSYKKSAGYAFEFDINEKIPEIKTRKK